MNGNPMDVLLVEDNPDHAELVMFALEDRGPATTVHHVSDGQAALDYLFRRGDYADPACSPRPHLILLDLRMPKLDGLEVLQEIKSAPDLRRLPVVVLTSSDAESDVAAAYGYHANGYVIKPMGFEAFCELVGDVASYWLVRNRLAA